MSAIIVTLSDAQRGVIRSLVDVTVDADEGGSTLRKALATLDNASNALTKAEKNALYSALALVETHAEDDPGLWGQTYRSLQSAIRKVVVQSTKEKT